MVRPTPEMMQAMGREGPAALAPLTIAFNCRSFMSRQTTGIGRYASGLVRSLGEIDAANRYLLYAPKGIFDRKRTLPRIAAANFTTKADLFRRGLKKTVGKVDIYHAFSPEIFDVEAGKIIVTVHDLVYKAYPQGHTDATIRLTDEQFKFFVPKASRFICCSQNTARDLMKYFNVDASRIRVVYPGIDGKVFRRLEGGDLEKAGARIRALGLSAPYILFIGTLEPRKNLRNLIEAFSLLKEQGRYKGRLVVVGMKGWKTQEVISSSVAADILSQIDFTGFLPDEDLSALYNLADCFAFPSHYEGFGFPIIEALGCGAPTLTSNTSSCQEVAADAALCVDPRDAKAMAAALDKLLHDAALRETLSARGFKRAKEFSRSACARKTLEVYRGIHEN